MKPQREPEVTREVGRAHGLADQEYDLMVDILARKPTFTELGLFMSAWSEHCSYKSSRIYLKDLPTTGPVVVHGPGENAGVIDIGDGQVAVFKMESHNHPSFVEPYQGAATGVGGILRDVFTMGARPIANLNALRFGPPEHPRTAYLVAGVVSGIGGYGNSVGVPTVGGDVYFDECYAGNILVNAFTLGIAKREGIFLGHAAGVGNGLLYFGAKTGRDGIHGASLLASAEFDASSEEKRPTVQVGDPFTEKLLLEASLELMSIPGLLVGIQDMGAAGLTSSSIEMAARAGNGVELDLDTVPLREAGMSAYEIMLSESQERMLAVVEKGREAEALKVLEKWDLDAAFVGKVTETGRVVLKRNGQVVADVPAKPLAEGLRYDRPRRRAEYVDVVTKVDPLSRPQPKPADLGQALLEILRSPNVASKEWVYRQYDHMVRVGTVVGPGSGDAAVIRVARPNGGEKGLGLVVDCNARFCYLDPFEGSRLAVAECARNLATTGVRPMAVTDCLNFASPERPETMWQFSESIRGLAEACKAFGTPVVSGNVSFYNETEGKGIFPTPMIGMVGVIDDPTKAVTQAFKGEGDLVALLGRQTAPDLGGSEYLKVFHAEVAGPCPRLDLDAEKRLHAALLTLADKRLLRSAHDLSEGGLAAATAESAMSSEVWVGVTLKLPTGDLPELAKLFGESPSRVLVSFSPANRGAVEKEVAGAGVPLEVLGTTGGRRFKLGDNIDFSLETVSEAWRSGFRRVVE